MSKKKVIAEYIARLETALCEAGKIIPYRAGQDDGFQNARRVVFESCGFHSRELAEVSPMAKAIREAKTKAGF